MRNKKAQSVLVYAFLIAIIIAALIAMNRYLSRAIQGKLRDSADVFGGGAQYEPGVTK